MEISYGFQPFSKNGSFMLGSYLQNILKNGLVYDTIWFVSFSLKRGGLIRILPEIKNAIKKGTKCYFIIGIDHNSTSYEALDELLRLNIDVKIVKNSSLGHTFHPKIYLFESKEKKADLFIGSSNMTAGGMYTNYEGNIHLSFDLPDKDKVEYEKLKKELEPLINPNGKIVQKLTSNLLQILEKRKEVQKEVAFRQTNRRFSIGNKKMEASPFGSSTFPDLPPIPSEYQQRLKKEAEKKSKKVSAILSVNAFYLQLNRGQSSTSSVPGEIRIPKAARSLDEDFWGWSDKYKTKYKQRGKIRRKYMERYAKWKIIDADNPANIQLDNEVRMYDYKERGEFRFYSGKLKELNPDEMDIVKITNSVDPKVDYVCELTRKGSSKYGEWLSYCQIPITGSQRMFGFT